ncbi:MAG: hypothetical protein IK015_03145 [Treponema sp.]|nr:hypothetical protein [Treponema sp.]
MKTVLIELLGFVLICVFGTAAGGFIIMIYHSVTSFVVGSQMSIFDAQIFINGAIVFFPILLLFTPMFLFLSLIRHPRYNKVSGVITIAVLCLAAWVLIAPVSYTIAREQSVALKEKPTDLTAGYFRTIDKRLYYFTFISGNYVKGLRVKDDYFSTSLTSQSVTTLDGNYINFKRDALGFSDPLIGENLTPPPILLNFINGIGIIQKEANQACQGGKLPWLVFSSLMLALVAIGAIVSASEWKLADAFYITFDTFAILTLNCLYYLGHFDTFISAINDIGGIAVVVGQNFQCALNCAIILALVLLGSVKGIIHAGKNRRRAR